MSITNLSSNNSPEAIRRYREGWEAAFGPGPARGSVGDSEDVTVANLNVKGDIPVGEEARENE